MQLGTVVGKTTTRTFSFDAESRIRKTDYVTLKDPEGIWVLAGIDRITTDGSRTRADASVIGFRDSRGFLKSPSVPFSPGSPVFAAEVRFIKDTIGLKDSGAYVGLLDGYDMKVRLPIDNLVKKHISVLAKTGTGKSYLTGVLMEELMENRVPAVVIDPHGEYFTLQSANSKPAENRFMPRFDVEPKSYRSQIQMYGFRMGKEIKLNSRLAAEEIMHILPVGLSASQKVLLYSSVKKLEGQEYSLTDVMDEVSKARSQAKWSLVSSLESLVKTGLFSTKPTSPEELVKEGKISIVDLKEARPEIQHMVVMKLAEELFSARKRGKIPPFLFVLEEAHNFCPERGFGEVASSKILRTIASEGRKFGMGLMAVSQRPARVDKNVLSQCNTQIILKVTNPNDLNAISESVEGMGGGAKDDIRDLPVGVAMIVGITDQPLIVDIRIRRSEHGGDNVKMQQRYVEEPETGPPSVHRMFQPKVSKDEILFRYKGADAVDLLKYPLWKVSSGKRAFYVDGMTGSLILERDGSLERVPFPKRMPREAVSMRKEPSETSPPGLLIEPSFHPEKALPGLKAQKMELVYYPYWLVKKKGRKLLVDGLTERMDTQATEAVRERV
ncbi:MAG TPA: ATP-binding protein [archaeon]|nr:ATP-binding protein [archaeon]